MSVEIGVPSKTISYLNLTKEYKNDGDKCSIDERWSTPIIDKQDNYMCAVTRFEVPCNLVPVTQRMPNAIQIYRYNDDNQVILVNSIDILQGRGALNGNNIEDLGGGLTRQQCIDYLEACEENDHEMTTGPDGLTIDLEPCFTIYEFVKMVNDQLTECLVMSTNAQMFSPTISSGQATTFRSQDPFNRNLFTTANGDIVNMVEPIATCKLVMGADYRFSFVMNHAFCEHYYIKLSPPLFRMLQFKENISPQFIRTDLPGRRFMGARVIQDMDSLAGLQETTPPYVPGGRTLSAMVPYVAPGGVAHPVNDATNRLASFYNFDTVEYRTSFIAPNSAADSINRIKSIVFTSSLPTTSEATSGLTYRRILTDYTVPTSSGFSWDPKTLTPGSVSENAGSEYSFANSNPSAGRWCLINSPAPLYEIKIDVYAKCWNFETQTYDYEFIYLPPGATFSCKIVFVSKNDIYRRERPDATKG